MLTAAQIEASFDTYLQSKARKGALLISGDWGSGKTFLVLKKLKLASETAGYTSIYLTVADIENQEGFERNLWIASFNLSNDNKKKIAGIGTGFVQRWLGNHGVSLAELAALRSSLTDKHLLFVDDIERTTPELRTRVLYRLANLAETSGVKIVILADEKQIKDDDKSYARIKEKAIGKTIEFQPTYEELAKTAVDVVFSSAPKTSKNAKWALQDSLEVSEFTDLVTKVLKQSTCRNLRTAIAAVIDACEAADALSKNNHSPTKEQLRSLIYSTLVLVVEMRVDKENLKALRKYVSSGVELPWIHFMNSSDPLKEVLTEFEKKYVDLNEIRFLRSAALLNFVEKGAYNDQEIWIDLSVISPSDDTSPAFKQLAKYQSISEKEFDLLAAKAIAELEDLKLRSMHLVAESATTLFFLARKNLVDFLPSELKLTFFGTLEKLATAYRTGETDISLDYDQNLLWGQPDNELKLVLEYIQTTTNSLEAIRFERFKTSQLNALIDNPSEFVNTLVSSESPIAMRECLNSDDAIRLFKMIKQTFETSPISHFTIHKLERAVAYRYGVKGFGINFKTEVEFLKTLWSELQILQIPDSNKLIEDAITTLKLTLVESIQRVSARPPL